jgi:hypothetical protein
MRIDWLDTLTPPIPTADLTLTARRGLNLARTLQQHWQGAHGDGINTLANYHRVHPATIRRWITTAQHQLQQPTRTCQLCDHPLPLGSRSTRRYCTDHANTQARVRRHRHKHTQTRARARGRSQPLADWPVR